MRLLVCALSVLAHRLMQPMVQVLPLRISPALPLLQSGKQVACESQAGNCPQLVAWPPTDDGALLRERNVTGEMSAGRWWFVSVGLVGAALSLRCRATTQLAVSNMSPDVLAATRGRTAKRGVALGRLRPRKRSSSPCMTLSEVMLSRQLKEGTKTSHSAAENTKFIGQFLKGVLDREQYRKLITDFYYVYDTMEHRIRETQDPLAGTLKQWQVTLDRVAFLEEDLRYYYGPAWRDQILPSEACREYCSRINEIAAKDPYLLIAHHYARYIGDLSGGQILKGIAVKALNQADGEGLRFYDFPSIDDPKSFKTHYRGVLDELELDEQQRIALIAEANHAFRLNMDVFDELEGDIYSMANSCWGMFWKRFKVATSAKGTNAFDI